MSERTFRLVQGVYLLVSLYLGWDTAVLALIALYTFEGLTNLRIPALVSRVRYGAGGAAALANPSCRFSVEAERLQRLLMAVFLYFTFVLYPQAAWFGPWFLGCLLLMAGVTNICPAVFFLRWVGFR